MKKISSFLGWYKYLKNDVAIDLSGWFYYDDVEDHLEQHLVIEEYVDGKKTGTFYDKYDEETLVGQWENVDGSGVMGFRLERWNRKQSESLQIGRHKNNEFKSIEGNMTMVIHMNALTVTIDGRLKINLRRL